jgi:SAM-dependent MidA family methyltransferase
VTPLIQHLSQRIREEGPLPFSEFMRECLYHPLFGYYSSGRALIGTEGDYFTAVSVGPLLGKLLARQFYEMWLCLGSPQQWHLMEQGAHSGQLARDIFEHLRCMAPACFAATHLHLIEPFGPLRRLQQTTLDEFFSRISWWEDINQAPPFIGVHYSNELLDAMPVHVLQRTSTDWREMLVDFVNDSPAFVQCPAAIDHPDLLLCSQSLCSVPDGFLREVCPAYSKWLEPLSLKLQRGWTLILDYGLTEAELALPHRSSGTLTGFRKHKRAASVFDHPGDQDITHHVNFSAVGTAALKRGLQVVAYTTQAQFLTPLGVKYFEQSASSPGAERSREIRAFGTLTHPDAMGHKFKSLLLSTRCCSHFPLEGATFGSLGRIP